MSKNNLAFFSVSQPYYYFSHHQHRSLHWRTRRHVFLLSVRSLFEFFFLFRILACCCFYFPTTMVLMYCYGSAFHVNKLRLKRVVCVNTPEIVSGDHIERVSRDIVYNRKYKKLIKSFSRDSTSSDFKQSPSFFLFDDFLLNYWSVKR